MMTIQNHIISDMLAWLQDNNFKHRLTNIKTDNGALNILYNDKFCLKIYDRLGHGFDVTINVADKYDETLYDNDSFSLHWSFKYFNIKQKASFSDRTENQYTENLPKLMADLKNIIPRLNKLNPLEWKNMEDWISKEAKKQFT
jgi:hypothetical protein